MGPLGRPTADPLTPLRGPRGSPVGRPRGPTTLYPRRGFSPAEIAHLGAPPVQLAQLPHLYPRRGFSPAKCPFGKTPVQLAQLPYCTPGGVSPQGSWFYFRAVVSRYWYGCLMWPGTAHTGFWYRRAGLRSFIFTGLESLRSPRVSVRLLLAVYTG